MKNQFLLLIGALLCLLSRPAAAQLPPVNLPPGTNFCNNTWKLVFYDEFNGNSLDSSKWITHNSWRGMNEMVNGVNISGDHENWEEGRIRAPFNSILKKENIIVSNGTIKLLAKNETNTWQCAACPAPITKHLSQGAIATRFNEKPYGVARYFNSGRFEFRAKFPTFKHAHSSVHLWYGRQVNEIDIAEAYGGNESSIWINKRPKNTYVTHSWRPEGPNPYGLPEDQTLGGEYPNQNWWQYIHGNNLDSRQDNWHTYSCEWDTASIKFYFDGQLRQTYWKYHKRNYVGYNNGGSYVLYEIRTPVGCNPQSGQYHITEGYPYYDSADMQVRIGPGFAEADNGIPGQNFVRGEMEVDYIRIYQKNPARDGYTELCNSPVPEILGPTDLCVNTVYGLSFAAPGGTWSASNNSVTLSGSGASGSNSNVVMVSRNPSSPINQVTLFYTYSPTGCPPVTISKVINTGAIQAQIGVVRNVGLFNQKFQLTASPVIAGATYLWKVWFGTPYANNNYYTASGPYITTPTVPGSFLSPYYVNWELQIVTNCGSRIITGSKDNLLFNMTPVASIPGTYMTKDSAAFYLEARLNSEDSFRYEKTVEQMVAKEFFEDVRDTTAIQEIIGRIRMEAIEPHLYFEREEDYVPAMSTLVINSAKSSLVYPNPGKDLIAVKLSDQFDSGKEISYQIVSLQGVIQSESEFNERIDISMLPAGNYILKLNQNKLNVESIKFIKE